MALGSPALFCAASRGTAGTGRHHRSEERKQWWKETLHLGEARDCTPAEGTQPALCLEGVVALAIGRAFGALSSQPASHHSTLLPPSHTWGHGGEEFLLQGGYQPGSPRSHRLGRGVGRLLSSLRTELGSRPSGDCVRGASSFLPSPQFSGPSATSSKFSADRGSAPH